MSLERVNFYQKVCYQSSHIAVWLFDENIKKIIKNGQGQDQRVVS